MRLPDIDALWDYADPAGSERRFRELLPQALREADDAYVCELLSQTARAVCLQRDYAGALALVDRADALLDDRHERPRIRCLLERGRILRDLDRAPEALPLFEEAWQIAERIEERVLAADALHMIAYATEGEVSLRWHRKAIEFCEGCEGERFRRWLCTLHTNIADKYEALGDYARAIDHVEQSREIAEQLQWHQRIVGSKCFLARLHRLDGDLEEAMLFVQAVFREDETSLPGYAWEERAECLLASGDEAGARTHFRRAHEELSTDPWYPPTETERLARIARLAGLA